MKRSRAAITIFLLLALTVSCGTKPEERSNRPVAPRDPNALYDGMDVSSHQRDIDWKRVGNNHSIKFVYIKATEGATYSSPHYAFNLKMARRYGIMVGSYHYLRSTSSLRDQYDNFVKTASKEAQDLIPMVDVEHRGSWSRQQLIDSLSVFVEMLKKHYGTDPMIYSTMAFYNANLSPYFNKYHLYIGRYSNLSPDIKWKGKYTIWQFSETGMIDGVVTPVDLCKFSSSYWLNDIAMPRSSAHSNS